MNLVDPWYNMVHQLWLYTMVQHGTSAMALCYGTTWYINYGYIPWHIRYWLHAMVQHGTSTMAIYHGTTWYINYGYIPGYNMLFNYGYMPCTTWHINYGFIPWYIMVLLLHLLYLHSFSLLIFFYPKA
ncbi:hypothetical protein CDAR_263841 [Caerostris darwini]|uniref:Cytochrome b n=1 Tax=Caerostris darwini TaxID=1538125 RepID=A0AAV4REL5_9ARAC|nr:hypothetical protein CDAR_263841 [Caerostris darwini]